MDAAHHRGLERLYGAAPCNAPYAASVSVADGTAEVRLAVTPAMFHGAGALHGHVLFKALDDAAFFAANSVVEGELLLTAAFHVHFLRPVRGTHLVARGRVVHRARRIVVAEAVALDERAREVARGSGTFAPAGVPLADLPAYRPVGAAAAPPPTSGEPPPDAGPRRPVTRT